jgi:hypothetical protein
MLTTDLQRLFECGSWVHDTVEFNQILEACNKSYSSLDETPISFLEILRLTNISFAIDSTASRPDLELIWRRFAIWCAEPFAIYVSDRSCLDALEATKEYVKKNKLHSVALTDVHNAAFSSYSKSEAVDFNSAHYIANRIMAHVSNPSFSQSVEECFNMYALGMSFIGQDICESEKLQTMKFIELVS